MKKQKELIASDNGNFYVDGANVTKEDYEKEIIKQQLNRIEIKINKILKK